MNSNDVAGGILNTPVGILVSFIIIFLVFRELICWYWKINLNVALLTEIRGKINHNVTLLTEIRDLLAGKENSQTEADSSNPAGMEFENLQAKSSQITSIASSTEYHKDGSSTTTHPEAP